MVSNGHNRELKRQPCAVLELPAGGLIYHAGRGVKRDDAEAAQWFRKAAEQGHTGAQVNLGILYANGWGVKQDPAEAARWYRAAADQGDVDAQYRLSRLYETGQGVQQDAAEAVTMAPRGRAAWSCRRAVKPCHHVRGGAGRETGRCLAYSWATFAALNERLNDKAVPLRDKLAARMTKEQIAAAEQQLNEWRTRPERQ